MQSPKTKCVHSCPKTVVPLTTNKKYNWLMWIFPVAGLVSLIWFLIRVIPKPSRAAYPCQRMAFPLASGFIAWITALVASTFAFKKAKVSLAKKRYLVVLACMGLSIGAMLFALGITDEKTVLAEPHTANAPIGTAKGIYPGRVVWAHNPDATDWDGPGNGHWWKPEHTNQQLCDEMMSQTIRRLTGISTDKGAWDAIFRYHNKTRNKGDVGYRPGEKITIKVNFVGFIRTMEAVNRKTYKLQDWVDYMNTSPQMITALLRQLTQATGVRQDDITIGDGLTYFAQEYYDTLHKEFPDVKYLDCNGKAGRVKEDFSSTPLYWSCKPQGCEQDYIPKSFEQAEYLINLANLKAHPLAGVTLCAKNHYGSLIRTPPEKGYFDMHKDLSSKETSQYRNLVDLMGHAHIGGKTLLYLLDGLYAGLHYRERVPRKFPSEPFNNDWASSLLASLDPVAIDSVGLDILQENIPQYAGMSGSDDYLHEAALADNPPSGTFYDPDHSRNVKRLQSLGVHEHWNNPKDRQYSRNLGTGKGIELVTLTKADFAKSGIIAPGAKVEKLADGFEFTEGPAVDAEGNVFFTDQPNDRICKWSTDGKLSVFLQPCGRSNGLFFDESGYLYACADENNELWFIDKQGRHSRLVKNYKGKKLNGPNDLWLDPKNGIYFTDPLYKRNYWTRDPAMQQDGQHVYYLGPDRKMLIRVAEDLVQPNGIIGTPDGKLLYVADIGDRKTYVYNIETDGTLSGKKLFCSMGSDGMTIDNEGNVYLTGRGVTVFSSNGKKIEHIDIDAGWTANVCFAGEDRHTLFITAQKSLFSLRMRVKGVK
ncbi:MAG: SMP-30/gluconolactonase/LRE family protein [Sedimentisphaerales bacterium]|nr:SMP-30/gluconolactonase/LRE family protein [Sedimentisphaerales bacterium]